MVNDVIVNLKFDANVLATIGTFASIIVGVFIGVYQILNSRKLAKLESNLKNKGRIFEDKYSKTMIVLEKMGLLKSATSKFVSFHNNLKKMSIDQNTVNIAYNILNEYIEIRNDFINYSTSSRYWIGDEIVETINKLNKPTQEVCSEFTNLCRILDRIVKQGNNNSNKNNMGILQYYNSNKVIKLLDTIKKNMIGLEDICIEKFKS